MDNIAANQKLIESLDRIVGLLEQSTNQINLIDAASLVVLIVTAVIIGLYALQTRSLRIETATQREFQLLPLIAIYIRGETIKEKKIRIRNIGKGAALNIKIKDYKFRAGPLVYTVKFNVKGTNALTVEEEQDLITSVFKGKHRVGSMESILFPHFDPEFAIKTIDLRISFENAVGEKYTTTHRTGKGGIFILKPPTKKVKAE